MEIPKPLLDDIANQRCLPIIGAGFSLNAKLPEGYKMPDWDELAQKITQHGNIPNNLNKLQIFSEYERKFGRIKLIEKIKKELYIDIASLGDAHKAFAELPFDTIYTTNFDILLEKAYEAINKPYHSLVGEKQLPFHGGPFTTNIIKMHGDVKHQEHLIITQEDYDNFLDNYPVIATHLSAMLITRTPLFIGYSLNDSDFNHILQVIRSRLGKFEQMSYILEFDQKTDYIDNKYDEKLHVLSLNTVSDLSKDTLLSNFFKSIQQNVDITESVKIRKKNPEIYEIISPDRFEKILKSADSSSLLTSTSNSCFVIMPFDLKFQKIYTDLINPAVKKLKKFGLSTIRADEIHHPGNILEQIRVSIRQARLCIAVITSKNPNVLYELGISHTFGKPTILLTEKTEETPLDVPFDLRSFRIIIYDPKHPENSIEILKNTIDAILGDDTIMMEVNDLVKEGLFRGAAAKLGLLIEEKLQQIINNNIDKIPEKIIIKRTFEIGYSLKLLCHHRIISKEDCNLLSKCVQIRNAAVHRQNEGVKELDKLDIDFMKNCIVRLQSNVS